MDLLTGVIVGSIAFIVLYTAFTVLLLHWLGEAGEEPEEDEADG